MLGKRNLKAAPPVQLDRATISADAEDLRQKLLADPNDGSLWQRLGTRLSTLGNHVEAVSAFEKAASLNASLRLQAQSHALSLSALERHADAVDLLQPIYAKRPKDFALLNLLGVMMKRSGRLQEAAKLFEAGTKLQPRNVACWQNIGNTQMLLGKPDAAATAFGRATQITPKDAELWRLLGRAQLMSGRETEARGSAEKALALAPTDQEVLGLLVQILVRSKAFTEAKEKIESFLKRSVDSAQARVLLASIDFRIGDIDAAKLVLNEILAGDPGHLGANMLLGTIFGDSDRREANAAYRRAVAGNPHSSDALDSLIDSLSRSRYDNEAAHLEEAYAAGCLFMQRFPERIQQSSRSLRTLFMRVLDFPRMKRTGSLDELLPVWQARGNQSAVHYELGQVRNFEDRLAIVEWHREWGRRVSARIERENPVPMPAISTGRKLRIGFMSSDLREHPVTYFAMPLLEQYDRDRIDVYCYSFYEGKKSRVQSHIESAVTQFNWWPQCPDYEVAKRIAGDGLDILFELGGSTAMNKLEVMAARPARIGASWLGYPHSAGLEAIDYILTDPYIKPSDPRLLIERPFEMPETWVAIGGIGFRNEPITEGLPQDRTGHITFGTANNPYKYVPSCIDLWAAVLRAVPNSHFLFLRPEGSAPSFIANSRKEFSDRDVDPARIDFVGIRGAHLQHYNSIDIALDSLPHVGGTTTCESLWMGVPTITLVGPAFFERLSYSNLSNAGLRDLAAFTPTEYVAKAVELAADRSRRLHLRHGLRDQIRANPLGQADRFVRNFYELARKVASE